MTNQTHRRNLTVYQVTKTKVDVKIPILLNGKVQHRVEKLTATWIDKETGELFTEKQARLLDCPAFDYGIMILQREYILSKLSPESRAFAEFILQFRNKRRSLTPGISELCIWYAKYSGRRSDNVRRNVNQLVEAGVLSADNHDVLMPLFQFSDKKANATEYLSEMFVAKNTFDRLMRSRPLSESLKQ